jgi:anti-anti-sigma regulatory factor
VYAPQQQPIPAPLTIRLIGTLDDDLIAAFTALERGLVAARGATVLVDVRDLNVLSESVMHDFAGAVARARLEGRDVRLDARGFQWKRVVKKNLSMQPPVDPQLRSEIRRTVILARSASGKRR